MGPSPRLPPLFILRPHWKPNETDPRSATYLYQFYGENTLTTILFRPYRNLSPIQWIRRRFWYYVYNIMLLCAHTVLCQQKTVCAYHCCCYFFNEPTFLFNYTAANNSVLNQENISMVDSRAARENKAEENEQSAIDLIDHGHLFGETGMYVWQISRCL